MSDKKKLRVGCAFVLGGLLISGLCFAKITKEDLSYHGWYIGASLGYDYASLANQFLYNFETSHGPSTLDGHVNTNMNGFVGGGFLGYGVMVQNFLYLGVEVFGNGSTASGSSQAVYQHFHDEGLYDKDGFNDSVVVHNNFGVSLLPGIEISPNALLYGRVGYSRAHISGNENHILYANPVTPDTVVTANAYAVSMNGLAYGLGLETSLLQFLRTRLEIIHTGYHAFTSPLGNTMTLSDNQVLFGVLYRT